MDTANFRDLAVEEFDTRTLLAHASAQAKHRRYEDFFIVDVDGHHWEAASYPKITEYIEDPVLRQQTHYQGVGGRGITTGNGSYQEMAGRITRQDGRRAETLAPTQHRDIELTRRWMDAMGIDAVCLFPTPMLGLPFAHRPEVEVAMARAYNRWLIETVLADEPRIRASLYLPLSDPAATLKMVEDFGDKKGVAGFTIISAAQRPVTDNLYCKTYAAIEERGLPLVFHAGLMGNAHTSMQLCTRFMAVHALSFSFSNILHMTNWLCNGMPERFPKLKTVWVESGLAWVPFVMQRLDNEYMMRSNEVPLIEAEAERLYARDVFLVAADGGGGQPRRARGDAEHDQRRDAASLFVGLSALGHGPAERHLRPAVPVGTGQAQYPRRQRAARLQSGADLVGCEAGAAGGTQGLTLRL